MDILKIFRMQEPISKEQFIKNGDGNRVKSKETITDLQQRINELQEENKILLEKLSNKNDDNEFQKIMRSYEKFISKLLLERTKLLDYIRSFQTHFANYEVSFNQLLNKFNTAKHVIKGYKLNEELLKSQVQKYEELINSLNEKYDSLKSYSENKLTEANVVLSRKDEENIKEVAKLKTKILESQARISDLEQNVRMEENSSFFAPLKSNIIMSKNT